MPKLVGTQSATSDYILQKVTSNTNDIIITNNPEVYSNTPHLSPQIGLNHINTLNNLIVESNNNSSSIIGEFSPFVIPSVAFSKLITVADITKVDPTVTILSNGDTLLDNSSNLMYFVYDKTKLTGQYLNVTLALKLYTATIPWGAIQPVTIPTNVSNLNLALSQPSAVAIPPANFNLLNSANLVNLSSVTPTINSGDFVILKNQNIINLASNLTNTITPAQFNVLTSADPITGIFNKSVIPAIPISNSTDNFSGAGPIFSLTPTGSSETKITCVNGDSYKITTGFADGTTIVFTILPNGQTSQSATILPGTGVTFHWAGNANPTPPNSSGRILSSPGLATALCVDATNNIWILSGAGLQ